MTLRILAEAESEIEAARQYLNAQSTSARGAFLGELARALDAVAARPLSFARLETLPIDQPYRRALLEDFATQLSLRSWPTRSW